MELDLQRKMNIFCSGCDHQEPSGVCKLGSDDQVKYIIREECGWAMVDGAQGRMTLDGFIVDSGSIPNKNQE